MNKNMKPGPKPRKTTQEFFEQIEHHASRGLSQQQICHALGISETWWYEAKHKNREISESFKKGQAQGIGEVSNAIYEQALAGSTGAACFFLKNRDPDRWSDVKSVNAVQINVSKLSDSQLLEEIRSDPVITNSLQSVIPQLIEKE
ncbi:uncharacterized protein METZ01_LOCUS174747 [marine metagenome]|uniref:Homeodomain phBC6A51-type domain-containing protein n=1 Tax=marine metagenome TaxID=408172 RepID=A0A382C9D5_9ZZZZ